MGIFQILGIIMICIAVYKNVQGVRKRNGGSGGSGEVFGRRPDSTGQEMHKLRLLWRREPRTYGA